MEAAQSARQPIDVLADVLPPLDPPAPMDVQVSRCAFEGQGGPCWGTPVPGVNYAVLTCTGHTSDPRNLKPGERYPIYRPNLLWDDMARAAYEGEWTHERDPVTGLPAMLRLRPFDELPQEERARWWRDMAALAEWCEWVQAWQEYDAITARAQNGYLLYSPLTRQQANGGGYGPLPPPYPGTVHGGRRPETLGDIAAVAIARDRAKPAPVTHGWEPASRLYAASGGVLDVLSDSLGGPARREGETDQELLRRVLAEIKPPQRGTLESLVSIIREYPPDLTFAQQAEMMERLQAARPAVVALGFMSDVQDGERFFRVRVSHGGVVDIIERRRDGVTTRHRESCPLALRRL